MSLKAVKVVVSGVPETEHGPDAVKDALTRIHRMVGPAGFTALCDGPGVPILHDRTAARLDLAVWADLVARTVSAAEGAGPSAVSGRALLAAAGSIQAVLCLLARGDAVTVDGAPGVLPLTRGTDGSLIPVPGRPVLSRVEAEALSARVPREVLVQEPSADAAGQVH